MADSVDMELDFDEQLAFVEVHLAGFEEGEIGFEPPTEFRPLQGAGAWQGAGAVEGDPGWAIPDVEGSAGNVFACVYISYNFSNSSGYSVGVARK